MAREQNYLLGNGERLTNAHAIDKGSRPKVPPYQFPYSRDRLIGPVNEVAKWAESLPQDACPSGEVVAELVLHPRYISKTDYPSALLSQFGLRAVGRKAIDVSPEAWGTKKHPESATTDKLFIAGKRQAFSHWANELGTLNEHSMGARQLTQIESISPFLVDEKLIDVPTDGEYVAEVVLHNAGDSQLMAEFVKYANRRYIQVLIDKRRSVGWLSFVPARLTVEQTRDLAKFAFVRVVRSMPKLRSIANGPVRTYSFGIDLPDVDVASLSHRAVIFDGGIPEDVQTKLKRWVNVIEPKGIAKPIASFQLHGLAVTSSFLFGPLVAGKVVGRPLCPIDHVRVLDENSGSDLEYYDVLDRITNHLDTSQPYQFGCLCLGPNRPITDDEVTAWTAELDSRLAHGNLLLAVAVGNDGDLDADLGLNRIQPPSDGVNTFSVGASDSRGKNWNRAPYSSIGPGRCPGVFKPDGLAFGGVESRPFQVVGPSLSCLGLTGTSFAAPFGLRSCAGVASLLDTEIHPLTIRALAVHRAQTKRGKRHAEIGWGRFLEDPVELITCEDCEAVVVYQGTLPISEHLRAKIALPDIPLIGDVDITATLTIAPEVDPEHTSTYTRGGLAVMFRPDATHYELNEEGELKKEPETSDFFNTRRLSGRIPDYILRKDAHKWEPVLRATRRVQAANLNQPFFDIYHHRRQRGSSPKETLPLRYALVVTVRCEKVQDLYEQTVRAHQEILTPLQPMINVKVTV